MAISTTTFNERLIRLEDRAKKGHSKRRGAKRGRKGLVVFVAIGVLVAGASIAQESMPRFRVWAGAALEHVSALLPR